jgi:hypothetical protein
VASIAILLYTHYVSGLPVATAVCLLLLNKKWIAAVSALVAMLTLLYLSLARWKSAGTRPRPTSQSIKLSPLRTCFWCPSVLAKRSPLLVWCWAWHLRQPCLRVVATRRLDTDVASTDSHR